MEDSTAGEQALVHPLSSTLHPPDTPMPNLRSSALPLLLSTLLLAGCLPSSNQRKLERALFPSDSLSRQIAEAAPVDTLRLVRVVTAPPEAVLEFPTSLAFLPDGTLFIASEASGGTARLFRFDYQPL